METKLKLFLLILIDSILLTIFSAVLKKDFVILCFVFSIVLGISFFIILKILNKKIDEAQLNFEKAKQENEEAIKMRTDFVTNVTHELKTPLTSISGFVETLQNGAIEDKEARIRFLDIISDETKRLNRLIDDILSLSYIENYEEEEKEKFNLLEEIENAIKILKPIAQSKNILIKNEISVDYIILGKKDKFRQMMINLIENAIKYGKDDGHIWIKESIDEDFLIISVIDDGIGINALEIDRITERFYRVDKSRAKLVDGTGLGLSIVKHTVALFGGELKIDSKENEGSIFSVSIHVDKISNYRQY